MCYVEIYLFVTAHILVDLDVFRILSNAGSSMTFAQLAEKTNSDAALLGRLLKHVCTQDFVREAGIAEDVASQLTGKIAWVYLQHDRRLTSRRVITQTPGHQKATSGLILDMFHMYRVGDRYVDADPLPYQVVMLTSRSRRDD